MSQSLPHFDGPPVVETALSVQFAGIRGFGNAHLGLFWARHQSTFPILSDADPIEAQRELFGAERNQPPRPPRVRLGVDPAARLQMTTADQSRMVQVQNGRLVHNWRRTGDGGYPRWAAVKPDLIGYWKDFQAFIAGSNLPAAVPNQWEVIYVNHLLKGRDWASPADWADLVPGILGRSERLVGGNLEALAANWHMGLDGDGGRLHIELFHALGVSNSVPEAEPMELLSLQLTARGPIAGEGVEAIDAGLELGHVAIVQNFAAITGDAAHERWRRQA